MLIRDASVSMYPGEDTGIAWCYGTDDVLQDNNFCVLKISVTSLTESLSVFPILYNPLCLKNYSSARS